MAENLRNVQGNADEMDLGILVRNIAGFFKKYGNIIFLFSVVGLFSGAMTYMVTPKEYPSKLIAHSSILTNIEQIELIEDWREFLKKGETEVLARTFKIDPLILKKVTDIQARDVQKSAGSSNINGFIIEVLVKDTAVLDTLQKGMIYGLENNQYIKPRLELRKLEIAHMIQSVNEEIQTLDSSRYFFQKGQGAKNAGASGGGVIVDVSDLNTQMIALNEKLLLYKRELQFVSPIQVLQSFEKFKNPAKPKLLLLLFSGLLAGTFFGFVIAFIVYIRKLIL